ncbi:hypothetical protein JCM8097_001455 [Rhodosporidiobolus ruineniae]
MLPYRYINHDELADLLRASGKADEPKKVAVVDCRDEDFAGGNIPGAIRAPSEQRTDASIRKLVEELKDVPKVVFHCSLSQVRGPKTARIYAEAAAAAHLPLTAAPTSSSSTDPAEAAKHFSPNPFEGRKEGEQEVLVLRDGFKNWQALYKNDPVLVENHDKAVWVDYSSMFGPQAY